MRKKTSDAIFELLPLIPTTLTVLVAASAVAFGKLLSLGIDTKLSIILSTVALLATSDLVIRHREMRQLSSKIERACALIEANAGGEVSADVFFRDGVPIDAIGKEHWIEYLKNSDEISIVSTTFLRFVAQYGHLLKLRIQEGAKVRLVILNNDNHSIRIASLRSGDSIENWKSQLTATRVFLDDIRKHVPKAMLEVRTIEYNIAYGITILNSKDSERMIVVQIWPHLANHTITKPYFILKPDVDKKWFNFFKNQFDLTWEHAKPVNYFEASKANNKREH